jgi:hypothetical protein
VAPIADLFIQQLLFSGTAAGVIRVVALVRYAIVCADLFSGRSTACAGYAIAAWIFGKKTEVVGGGHAIQHGGSRFFIARPAIERWEG